MAAFRGQFTAFCLRTSHPEEGLETGIEDCLVRALEEIRRSKDKGRVERLYLIERQLLTILEAKERFEKRNLEEAIELHEHNRDWGDLTEEEAA